jgi:CheY-like chemotaxis protein
LDKKMKSNKNFLARFRGWIQAAATLLTNIHIPNLFKGKIYQRNVKTMCVPGLNCYSCPAATGACPIGAFQTVVGSSKFKFTYYITGFFILLGVLLGRFICGFLCPFGWFQDLLHKIPGKKLSTAKLKPLRYLKYVILVVLDLNLPGMDVMDILRELRKENEETKVLILSARSQIADKVDGLDAGTNDYMEKPFHLQELEARVRSLTRRKFVQKY